MPIRHRVTWPDQGFSDERFVMKRCALWLHRYLEGCCAMGEDTIKILCWVLDEQKVQLGQILLKQLRGAPRREFEEDLVESPPESEDYVDLLARTVRKAQPATLRRFARALLDLLVQRGEALCGGRESEIEKSMADFKKMFSLTDQEREFCIFLFVLTEWFICSFGPTRRFLTPGRAGSIGMQSRGATPSMA
jgi:hypothetical protein